MSLQIHKDIIEKLNYFKSIQKIPNIIFHGPTGSGKRTIVKQFIDSIYDNNKEKLKNFVIYVNCAHGKGIKFIREDLKFFAKTHINSNGGNMFKSIILLNADKLTMDAQSALRRCIELFSHNTRFFLVVEDKYNLLKPILSRFCEIYVPEPMIKEEIINLYQYNIAQTFHTHDFKKQRNEWLKKEMQKIGEKNGKLPAASDILDFSTKLYEKGYSGIDLIKFIENNTDTILKNDISKKYELLTAFNKVRKEIRNEKLLLFFILNFLILGLDQSLENISFM